jgi:hypothetical protein
MKCETTNTVLTFVLGMLAIAGVIFALQTIFLTREFRSLTVQATVANTSLMQVQALAQDVAAYNQKSPSPELTKLLTAAQTPQAPAPAKK